MNSSATSVTLTSKHQLTVPAAVVRRLKLSVGDRLTYKVEDDAIILRRRPTVSEQLADMWAKNAKLNKGMASDASIKESVRDYFRNQPAP